MSALGKTVTAVGFVVALGAAAIASDATEWLMKAGEGYAVDMQGRTVIIELKNEEAMMARAQVVQPGTIMFKHNGQLMMVFDRSVIGLGSR